MESRAERRIKAIQGHLVPATDESLLRISTNTTAGEFFNGNTWPQPADFYALSVGCFVYLDWRMNV